MGLGSSAGWDRACSQSWESAGCQPSRLALAGAAAVTQLCPTCVSSKKAAQACPHADKGAQKMQSRAAGAVVLAQRLRGSKSAVLTSHVMCSTLSYTSRLNVFICERQLRKSISLDSKD